MSSLKYHREKRHHSKKEKKLIKLIKPTSESEDEGSEHELSYYLNDKVKLMKEVLKIIKPKKIRTMAPDCIKNMDSEEINSMLLDELLGISNKRLKHIFNGQSLNEEDSSTDPEEQAEDIISLDDISDDDLVIDLDSDQESKKKKKKHRMKVKEETKRKKIKKEKHDKEHENKKSEIENPMSKSNLMSVLELLELQARARAIKSQLALETRISETTKEKSPKVKSEDDDDEVIVESPKNIEIIITSSESENESNSRKVKISKKSGRQTEKAAPLTEVSGNVRIINQTTIREADNTCKSSEKDIDVSNNSKNNSNGDIEEQRDLHDQTTESQTPESSEKTKTNSELATDDHQEVQNCNDHKKEIQEEEIVDTSSVSNKKLSDNNQNEKDNSSIESNSRPEHLPEKLISTSEEMSKFQEKDNETSKLDEQEVNNLSPTIKNKSKIRLLSKLKSIKHEKELLYKTVKKKSKKEAKEVINSSDDSEGIIIDLEQTEMDCINLD